VDPIIKGQLGRFRLSTAQPAIDESENKTEKRVVRINSKPTTAQHDWLARGLDQTGGKLPLFDDHGKRIDPRTIRTCIEQGWAEPWFANPLKPDWLVCKLMPLGREVLTRGK